MIATIVLFCLFPVLLYGFWMFDVIVRAEYANHRDLWENDGKPRGIFWIPREVRTLGGLGVSFRSSIARERCQYRWLFNTPQWIQDDEAVFVALRRFRICIATWNIVGLCIFAPLVILRK